MECDTCMAWSRLENQPEWGECRRHAPSPRTGPDSSANYGPFNLRGFWPYTRRVDYCFEYLAPETLEMPDGDGEEGYEEMPLPPPPVDQGLTPEKNVPENSFVSVVEQAQRIAYGK